ncbi:unnamed protein product [Cyprideis torosa]|uniref:Band 7 domain-containing protein n=1 Tax=Cyprideis torosa TaxID=163714 RepID=A0A7R8WB20_9CRUS|nr:unnamed protein product [Cyprideis torosa]CAG0889033.1 unnamed protein product [Cyprideis torosa]
MPDIEGGNCSFRGLPIWLFLVIGFVVIGVIFAIVCLADGGHTIEEGQVGIYFVNGALQPAVSYPGVHFMAPFVSRVEQITIRPDTSILKEVECVTRDGIKNYFYDVQVISSVEADKLVGIVRKFGSDFKRLLVLDRISEELRLFCANFTIDEVYNTMFLEIVERVLQNVKVQWTKQMVATQEQKTERIRKETEKIKAVLDAERNKAVLQIKIQEDILQKEGEKNISLINNEIQAAKEKNIADMEFYTQQQAAKANKELYSPDYVKLQLAKHLSTNTKLFFSGQDSVLGSLLGNIFGNENQTPSSG